MIARSILRCSATQRLTGVRSRQFQVKSRRYSSTSTSSSPNGTSPASLLGAFTDELDKIAPRFDIEGSQVKVIRSPADFYKTLKEKIRSAKSRIFLSTLYIGKTEHELVRLFSCSPKCF